MVWVDILSEFLENFTMEKICLKCGGNIRKVPTRLIEVQNTCVECDFIDWLKEDADESDS